MLNSFPDLLDYARLAPLILRVVAGLIFIDLGILVFKNEKERWLASLSFLKIPKPQLALKIIGCLEIAGGIMLILGFYTQIAALVLALFTFIESYMEYKEPVFLKRNFVFYFILFAITLSLLFSGAGAFAVDLPL
ncbi:MAG: DoxX family protein [Patescibacteria group bacterium]